MTTKSELDLRVEVLENCVRELAHLARELGASGVGYGILAVIPPRAEKAAAPPAVKARITIGGVALTEGQAALVCIAITAFNTSSSAPPWWLKSRECQPLKPSELNHQQLAAEVLALLRSAVKQ